jgi:hypothetical protein
MYDDVCIIWYGEDSDCVLVFFCSEAGPMYGFLYVFFIVWVGISIVNPFMFKGNAFRSKYGIPLEW